ncbi:pirin family protein [Engelhardtia mirabilis]|uniref:Quercetin 2,3-dioxygenase n=1 Tax=Engelhardtia mirabilis TaxID=2528011 RepID=A0A518BEZ8_9BACT|nr:Quercetin 2,3-dioxygenase [Planctomycetes bacterium Pla133]QDU99862.1 Quercetin 2,3-dioxygenase [Planctomycetes bacterium Pla86]
MTPQTTGFTTPDTRLQVRRADERGRGGASWLDARHSFSFAEYHDPDWMGFGPLRVINEDRVRASAGFPTHGHREMEILTWPLDGAIEHKDSMGSGSVLRPGMMQAMSAGKGVLHSEFNHNQDSELHLLQIWLEPDQFGGAPSYQERDFSGELDSGWRLVASPDGSDGSLTILQQARVFVTRLAAGGEASRELGGARTWVQVAKGAATVNGHAVRAGDALFGEGLDRIEAHADGEAELLLFELP